MRKFLIAGNWKMHGSRESVTSLTENILNGIKSFTDIDILVCPTYVHLVLVKNLIGNSNLHLGAQNLYPGAEGAFTGEVSAVMLKDLGCTYVIIGHSERRSLFKESHASIADKVKAAIAAGLTPILCVGETKEEREQNLTESIVKSQLQSVIEEVGIEAFKNIVIAYEPVWAIGTGLTATPDEAQQVHAFIRELIAQNDVDLAKTLRILYGGSMKADNAAKLLSMPDIDGGLIGGASLKAASFIDICEAAQNEFSVKKKDSVISTAQ